MPQVNDSYDAAPIRTHTRRVPPEWIDYNGHMNVAYYTMAFDQAYDEVLNERIGVGESLVRSSNMGPMVVQGQTHYLGELVEGEAFFCEFLLLDADPKRMHVFMTMIDAETGQVAATYETLTLNVDLETRRTAPYPDWAHDRLQRLRALHATLPRPELAGNPLGIRRRA